MPNQSSDNNLTLHGFLNPRHYREHRDGVIQDRRDFYPEPDMSLMVEIDQQNLQDCVGLLLWEGLSPDVFSSTKFSRIILSPEQAVELGLKLQQLGEARLYREAVNT